MRHLAIPIVVACLLLTSSTAPAQVRLTDSAINMTTGRDAFNASINRDGSVIAFRSDADYLSEGRADNDLEIWLWTAAGLERLTDALANGQSGRDADQPSISDEGDRVAFRSSADYLNQGSSRIEIWLWDASSGVSRLTDVTTNMKTGRDALNPAISGDGTRVAFASDADLLSEEIVDNDFNLWLWREGLPLMRLTDVAQYGAGTRRVNDISINSDGSRIAFWSDGDFLNQGRVDDDFDLWLWDSSAGLMRLTDVTANGKIDRDVANCTPWINDTGTRIAFCSDADFFNEGRLDNDWEIWLWDASTGLSRITDATINGKIDRDSFNASISGDGTTIAFRSDADLFNEGIADDQFETWVYDIAGSSFTRISSSSDGANRDTWNPSIDRDGSHVAFSSDSEMNGETIPLGDNEAWIWPTAVIFSDEFELGDLSRWSASTER